MSQVLLCTSQDKKKINSLFVLDVDKNRLNEQYFKKLFKDQNNLEFNADLKKNSEILEKLRLEKFS